MALKWDDPPDERVVILSDQELLELSKLREFFFSDGGPALVADRPSPTTIREFLADVTAVSSQCRCLVCQCSALRTIDYPVVCRECSKGWHDPEGGVK